MVWQALLLTLFIITVARIRQLGITWEDIAAAPSQWLHFIIFGGRWEHTVCSCVGKHVRDGTRNKAAWIVAEYILDCMFMWRERRHCARSLQRVENYKGATPNGLDFDTDDQWRPDEAAGISDPR